MTGFWISVLVFSTMYPVQSGRHRVTAQSSESDVYQPDKKLIVDIGDSATLQCYIFEVEVEEMIFFKQQNRKQPRIIVRFFNAARETFYNEFQNPRFQIKKHTNCFNLTILNTTLSDEAVYYCALTRPDPVFGEGTDLKFKGQSFTTESETSKPALCDHNTNMNTQEKTVKASTEGSAGTREDSHVDSWTYAALQFPKKGSGVCFSDKLVYSEVMYMKL
ncbi:signal-regulatory protein beta-1-like isoform X3 [Neoarius graeffei]|uniref:signal-regulatory protein beta-1-like isoform X3 n=1 Tax=Neoarius graeffei TaxID=443677 RepID=UPI00298C8E8D|nr:signal-regulatory protein beta-1-like isoform X3 [Neoarius graeffei]